MDEGVVLATERTVLRPWHPDEAGRLLDIRRRPEVARWLGDPTPWTDLDQAHEAIERWAVRTRAQAPLGAWAIVPNDLGVPVGTASMARLPNDDVEVEIGWNLHPDAVGHGWAREAAAAVLARAFEHGLARVWAIMWPHNERSAAVARAIGMIDLGVRPDPWYGEPEFPDSLMFRADRP